MPPRPAFAALALAAQQDASITARNIHQNRVHRPTSILSRSCVMAFSALSAGFVRP